MSSTTSSLIRGAMLGAASGILSQSGLATVLVRTPRSNLPRIAQDRWVRRGMFAAAVGETLANAFVSSLPARTDPPALAGRIISGGLSGMLATRRPGSRGIPAGIAGAVIAAGATWTATTGRARLAGHVPDLVIAGAETIVAFGLARRATD